MERTLIRNVHQKFPLVTIGGQVEGLVFADTGARSPIGASGNFTQSNLPSNLLLALSKPKHNQQLKSTEVEVILHSYREVHLTPPQPPQTLCVFDVVNSPASRQAVCVYNCTVTHRPV